jgi:hypothetical protein
MTDEALDEVVFEYLEGNLSGPEKEAFELLLSESEVMSHHVRLWKNSFIRESLPNVSTLEQRLHIPEPRAIASEKMIWKKLFIVLVLLTTSLSFKESVIDIRPSAVIEEQVNRVGENLPECTDIGKPVMQASSIKPLVLEPTPGFDQMATQVTLSTENVNTNILKTVVVGGSIAAIHKHTQPLPVLSQKTSLRELTRAEIRSMNRKKRKEEERKAAAKFMKGNEPYVVPLKGNF